MTRQILTGVGVGALVLVTAVLVVMALRPTPPPTIPEARLTLGAVDATDSSMWRWAGPSECAPGSDIVPLERKRAGGQWVKAPMPLVNVEVLSFDDDSTGVALGNTSSCARGVALTTDGGATWVMRDDNPVLQDAWWVDNRLWGIVQTDKGGELRAFRLKGRATLVPDERVPVTEQPCDAADGVPSDVAFYTPDVGLLLCEQPITEQRLIARTTTAGQTYERLSDDRPETGLNGAGPVLDLDVAAKDWAWTQFPQDEVCDEGQLRFSDSQGAVWKALPCPSDSVLIDQVLDATFTSARDGVMLGVLANEPLMLQTDDGGDTWSKLP